MRLREPRRGFGLAWGGNLGTEVSHTNAPTRRHRDLDAALEAEAETYGEAPHAESAAGWAPVTPQLLRKVHDGLLRHFNDHSQFSTIGDATQTNTPARPVDVERAQRFEGRT